MQLINRTPKSIVVDLSADSVPEYPTANHTEFYLGQILNDGDSTNLAENDGDWDRFFKISSGHKLYLFVYSADTLKKYNDIDYLKKHKLFETFEFSKEEIENQG